MDTPTLRKSLKRFLEDDYCARCDSFHVERKEYGALWCSVCWKHAKPLPSSLRRAIELVVAELDDM